ncbi:MAG: hypothetical protein VYA30_04810 [Myxococcota bacterium]|nr:hypothetical protein [Myxococcota bacterium]
MPQFLSVLVLFASPIVTLANPAVVVRGTSQFAELKSDYQDGALHFSGRLLDDSGDPIIDKRVDLRAKRLMRTSRTNQNGHFEFLLQAGSDPPSSANLIFHGAEFISGCQKRITVPKIHRPTRIQLSHPKEVNFGTEIKIGVLAIDDNESPSAEHRVMLYLADRQIGRCRTDAKGRCSWRLKSLPVGLHQLTVDLMDENKRVANATGQLVVSAKLDATIKLRERVIRDTPHLSVSVQMRGSFPADTAISLRTDERAIAQASVQNGRIVFEIPVESLLKDRGEFRVIARSSHPGWVDFTSDPFHYKKPSSIAMDTTLRWSLIFCLALMLAVYIRRRRAQQSGTPLIIETIPTLETNVEFVEQTGPASTPLIYVRCASTGKALVAKITALTHSMATRTDVFSPTFNSDSQVTGADGQIALQPGCEHLLVESDGFVPELVHVTKPGSSLRVRLWTHRASVQIGFMDVLAAAGIPIIKFGVDTIREATPKLIKRGFDPGRIQHLADETEFLCFGSASPTLTQVGSYHQVVRGLTDTEARGI